MKGIVRIDSDSTHGWQVRVYRFGKTFSKLFSDRKHGGRDAARAAALAYRDGLEGDVAALPETPRPRRLVRAFPDGRDGATGVARAIKHDRRGLAHEVYTVSWNPSPGVARGTSFSIRRYGEAEAFRRACALRWAKMREIHGDRYDVASPDDLVRRKADVDARAAHRTD